MEGKKDEEGRGLNREAEDRKTEREDAVLLVFKIEKESTAEQGQQTYYGTAYDIGAPKILLS